MMPLGLKDAGNLNNPYGPTGYSATLRCLLPTDPEFKRWGASSAAPGARRLARAGTRSFILSAQKERHLGRYNDTVPVPPRAKTTARRNGRGRRSRNRTAAKIPQFGSVLPAGFRGERHRSKLRRRVIFHVLILLKYFFIMICHSFYIYIPFIDFITKTLVFNINLSVLPYRLNSVHSHAKSVLHWSRMQRGRSPEFFPKLG